MLLWCIFLPTSGKSVLVQKYLYSLPSESYMPPNVLGFSARTTANTTQHLIDAKLDRRRKGETNASGSLSRLYSDGVHTSVMSVHVWELNHRYPGWYAGWLAGCAPVYWKIPYPAPTTKCTSADIQMRPAAIAIDCFECGVWGSWA